MRKFLIKRILFSSLLFKNKCSRMALKPRTIPMICSMIIWPVDQSMNISSSSSLFHPAILRFPLKRNSSFDLLVDDEKILSLHEKKGEKENEGKAFAKEVCETRMCHQSSQTLRGNEWRKWDEIRSWRRRFSLPESLIFQLVLEFDCLVNEMKTKMRQWNVRYLGTRIRVFP